MNVLSMARLYNKRPSELIGLYDEYESYCFDEACAFIIGKLEKKEEPNFEGVNQPGNKASSNKTYTKASDLYKDLYKTGDFDQV